AFGRIGFAPADGPAAGFVVRFVKPAVQDAQVQNAVDAGLHTAGAGRLLSAARRIQPDVHATHQFTSDLQTVILDEYDTAGQLRAARVPHDFADQALSGYIQGMSFAR